MLHKEMLISTAKPSVHVTCFYWGGRNTGTDFEWVAPDGTRKEGGTFDERIQVDYDFLCQKNSVVQIVTDDYSGSYTAIPAQEIAVEKLEYSHRLTFTAFRDVKITF